MNGRLLLVLCGLSLVVAIAHASQADLRSYASIRLGAPASNATGTNSTNSTGKGNHTHRANSTNATSNATAPSNKTVLLPTPKPVKPPNPAEAFMGNIKIARIMEAAVVVADAVFTQNLTAQGLVQVDGKITSKFVTAVSARAHVLETGMIMSPTGTVMVDGDMAIVNDPGLQSKVQAVSFIAEDVIIGGVRQWKLVRHDNFEGDNAAEGWSLVETSSCTGRDHFLGGHCNIANGEAAKTYQHLPPHTQVRVTGRYHMIDNWKGETAFLKLDEHYVWTEHSRKSANQATGIEMCGNESFPERRMSIPVDVTMPHEASFLEVAFGSTSLAKSGQEDPCDRSFGIDDVMIYVR